MPEVLTEIQIRSHQVAGLDKHIYDLNRACMKGEHWMVFQRPQDEGERSCACGRVKRSRPVGFIIREYPVYLVPTNIKGEPCNYGLGFAPQALEQFARGRRC